MSDEQQAPEILTPSKTPAPEEAPVDSAIRGTAAPVAVTPSRPWYQRLRLIHYVIILLLLLAIVTGRVSTPQQHTVSAPIATLTPIAHATPPPCTAPTIATAGAAATLRLPTQTASTSARSWSHGNN